MTRPKRGSQLAVLGIVSVVENMQVPHLVNGDRRRLLGIKVIKCLLVCEKTLVSRKDSHHKGFGPSVSAHATRDERSGSHRQSRLTRTIHSPPRFSSEPFAIIPNRGCGCHCRFLCCYHIHAKLSPLIIVFSIAASVRMYVQTKDQKMSRQKN